MCVCMGGRVLHQAILRHLAGCPSHKYRHLFSHYFLIARQTLLFLVEKICWKISFSFVCLKNLLIPSLFLKDIFAKYRILSWQLTFQLFKNAISFYSGLHFGDKKPATNWYQFFPLFYFFFSNWPLNFPFMFGFRQFEHMIFLVFIMFRTC